MNKIVLIVLVCLAAFAANAQDPNVRVEKMPVEVKLHGSDVWFVEPYVKDSIFCDSAQQCFMSSNQSRKVNVFHITDPTLFQGWSTFEISQCVRDAYLNGSKMLGNLQCTAKYKNFFSVELAYTAKQVVADKNAKQIHAAVVSGINIYKTGVPPFILLLFGIVLCYGLLWWRKSQPRPVGAVILLVFFYSIFLLLTSSVQCESYAPVQSLMVRDCFWVSNMAGYLICVFIIGCVGSPYWYHNRDITKLDEKEARKRFAKSYGSTEGISDDRCMKFAEQQILRRHRVTFSVVYGALFVLAYSLTGSVFLIGWIALGSLALICVSLIWSLIFRR